jgi:hypothetical protein
MNLARLAGGGLLAALCLLSTSASSGLGATAGRPTIRSVTPMTANVGDRLTIRGHNLATSRKRATVTFKVGARTVAVKVKRATRTKLTLFIPAALAKYMTVKDGVVQPTRVRLRVRAARTAKRYTALARSPRIGLPGSLPGGAPGGLTSLLPVLPAIDPSDDCNGDGVINDLDDVIIETVDGPHSICAADNNPGTAGTPAP